MRSCSSLLTALKKAEKRLDFATGCEIEQTLQIAGNENVHRGGHGHVEIAVAIIGAGSQKIGENIVGVGGANHMTDRQSHLLCQVGGKNIAKVSGGNTYVKGVAGLTFSAGEKWV